MEIYLGMIMIFAGTFAPRGFAFCNGQLLSTSQYTALFSLLGTTYGGNGIQTFGLPDLRGRAPIHFGQGNGLQNYALGQVGGAETVTLLQTNMPQHNHLLMGNNTATNPKDIPGPNHILGVSTTGQPYTTNPANVNFNVSAISMTGNSQPFDKRGPYLALNFVIATTGIFPSRN